MKGVDISPSYDPAEDFGQVAADGYGFAILKVTEGQSWPPANTPEAAWLPARYPAAKAAGLTVGTYHFTHPVAALSAADAEAAFFLSRLKISATDIVPFLDMETNPQGLSPSQLVAWARRWLVAVDNGLAALGYTGTRAGLYTYVSYLHSDLGGWNVDGRPLWLADPSNVAPSIARAITQTGQGAVAGIDSQVDLDAATSLPLVGGVSSTPTAPAPTTPPPAPAPAPSTWTPTVQNVDLSSASPSHFVTGAGVIPLQCLLAHYEPPLTIDGQGGPATRAALVRYQSQHGLAADAVAGPLTFDSLLSQD